MPTYYPGKHAVSFADFHFENIQDARLEESSAVGKSTIKYSSATITYRYPDGEIDELRLECPPTWASSGIIYSTMSDPPKPQIPLEICPGDGDSFMSKPSQYPRGAVSVDHQKCYGRRDSIFSSIFEICLRLIADKMGKSLEETILVMSNPHVIKWDKGAKMYATIKKNVGAKGTVQAPMVDSLNRDIHWDKVSGQDRSWLVIPTFTFRAFFGATKAMHSVSPVLVKMMFLKSGPGGPTTPVSTTLKAFTESEEAKAAADSLFGPPPAVEEILELPE